MNPLVVDASVVVKWFLPEALTEAALRVAGRDYEFVAPDLLGAEVISALWKRQRRGELDGAEAAAIVEDFRRIAIVTLPLTPLLPSAFAIAAAAGHSPYDCLYLALAEREDCRLVTADRRFYDAFADGPLGHRMLWIETA